MKILVTGGAGFLGRHLIAALQNHTVYNYDIVNGHSILDVDQLNRIFAEFRPSTVIHLAACADLNLFNTSRLANESLNIEGTRAVLAACIQVQARLLFASTCCVYGNTHIHPSTEETPPAPTEPYAQSKAMMEREIALPHCSMRLGTFYGPAMRPALAPAIFLDRAHTNQPIDVHGDGEQTRTMTYIDDIVSGICTILHSEPRYSVINVTSEEITSVNKMIHHAKALTGNDVPLNYVDDRAGQIYKEEISSQRLQSLGWKPKISFEEGMRRSYAYYVQNNHTWS